jgi:predicted TPR repeat methyltransferase
VRAAVESAGLKLSLLEDRSARNEDHAPVPGLVAVAAKT